VEPLLAALKGKDDEKCALAVGALGQIGDPRAGESHRPMVLVARSQCQVAGLANLLGRCSFQEKQIGAAFVVMSLMTTDTAGGARIHLLPAR